MFDSNICTHSVIHVPTLIKTEQTKDFTKASSVKKVGHQRGREEDDTQRDSKVSPKLQVSKARTSKKYGKVDI